MGATGIKYQKYFNNKYQQILRSQIALTTTGTDLNTREVNDLNILMDKNSILNQQWNGHFTLELNSKPGKKHNNYTGLKWRSLHYNLRLQEVNNGGSLLNTVDDKGRSSITTFYSSSLIQISPKLSLIAGFNSQYFALTDELLFEPRFSLSVQKNSQLKFSAGYGLHSRLEPLQYYFTRNISGALINQNVKSSKAHHLVASVLWSPAENYLIKIEPYYQFLFDIPVTEDHRLSFINLENEWFLNDRLLNTGVGQNLGIDFTLERYINRGFYGLFTCSIFNSQFKTDRKNDWLNTRFNSHFIANLLLGKEFILGSKQTKRLGINYRIAYQGGTPYTPVIENTSLTTGEIVFDSNQPFALRFPGAVVHHFTINYSISRPGTTHQISLKVLNAGSYKEFENFRINLISQEIEEYREALIIPNLSYKISF